MNHCENYSFFSKNKNICHFHFLGSTQNSDLAFSLGKPWYKSQFTSLLFTIIDSDYNAGRPYACSMKLEYLMRWPRCRDFMRLEALLVESLCQNYHMRCSETCLEWPPLQKQLVWKDHFRIYECFHLYLDSLQTETVWRATCLEKKILTSRVVVPDRFTVLHFYVTAMGSSSYTTDAVLEKNPLTRCSFGKESFDQVSQNLSYPTQSNDVISNKNISCVTNILDICTNPTAFCSLSSPPSSKSNSIYLAPSLLISAYLAILFILQMKYTAWAEQ